MDRRRAFHLHLVCLGSLLLLVSSTTETGDTAALRAFSARVQDPLGMLQNWEGDDPCGDSWAGVFCSDSLSATSTVIQLSLLNSSLTGQLAPELSNLINLQILDLMWNQLTGSIPKELGNLANLQLLLLNGNNLTGTIPDELGNLTNLKRFQIDSNYISGPVPTSLKNMKGVKHLHMNNNTLNGSIPPELGSLPSLVHVLLDNNNLSGALPKELASPVNITVIQLDNNQFTDATIPDEYGKNAHIYKLDLSHNNLFGELPAFSSETMIVIDLSYNLLNGSIPESYGKFSPLQYLELRNNNLTGPIPQSLGAIFSSTPSGEIVMDFQNNALSSFNTSWIISVNPRVHIWLHGNNAICKNSALTNICKNTTSGFFPEDQDDESPESLALCNGTCSSPEEPDPSAIVVDSFCYCAMPITVGYRLKSPCFDFFTSYVTQYQNWIARGIHVSPEQVYLESFYKMPGPLFDTVLKVFPSRTAGARTFNETEIMTIFDFFSTWKLPYNDTFGPQELLFFKYSLTSINLQSKTKLSGKAIGGIVVAGIAITAIVVVLVVWLGYFRTPRRMTPERRRLLSIRRLSTLGGITVAGARAFTYKELAAATKSFSATMQVGTGGYGNVYRGNLSDGQVVAIKCAREASQQGADEFFTEIELLSRVHHRNLVSLVGYCSDEGEQMLVYEFMANGTLRDHLKCSKAKRPLSFSRRLRIALGAARGIRYLHMEANPPIFHRDIKATNILLDAKFDAKVADFGLSKLATTSDTEGSTPGNISTMVKGTPGYLDPEYMRTHVLTNKSDVYSYGVVLLELITGMEPITFDKNIVREVKSAYENGSVLQMVDSRMGEYAVEAVGPLVRVALGCCKDDPLKRPTMAEVVQELEELWRSVVRSDSGLASDFVELEDLKLGSKLNLDEATSTHALNPSSLNFESRDFTPIHDLSPR